MFFDLPAGRQVDYLYLICFSIYTKETTEGFFCYSTMYKKVLY